MAGIHFELGEFDKALAFDVPVIDEAHINDIKENSFVLTFTRKTKSSIPFFFSATFTAAVRVPNLDELKDNKETIAEYAERVKWKIAEQAGPH